MRTLMITHVVNIVLNYLLIFGAFGAPKLGVVGAGIDGTIATCVAALDLVPSLARGAVDEIFAQPAWASGAALTGGAVGPSERPAVSFRSRAHSHVLDHRFSGHPSDGGGVLVNIMLVAILPGVGMGLAAATLVGQALGRGDPDDAERWGWDVARLAMVTLGLVGVIGIVFAEPVIGIFCATPTPRWRCYRFNCSEGSSRLIASGWC